jgi:hypothetical protein
MRKLSSLLLALAFVAALGRTAAAFPSFMQEGKAGIWMFNLKFGPAITARPFLNCAGMFCSPTLAAIDLNMGVAVDHARNAYIILPTPAFEVHDQFAIIMLPIGFQYDIPIHKVPGLYITPRFELGYAPLVPNVGSTVHMGFVEMAGGAKFIFNKRWNVGFEPISLAVFFGSQNNVNFTGVSFRLLWYGGVNF